MKITPLDIQQQQFKKKGGRYEAAEVDAFLEQVRLEMEELARICNTQAEDLKRLQAELAELRSQERLLKEAILTTQKVSEDIKKNSEKEAEVIIAEARMKAERIHDQARLEVERLHEEVVDLRRQRIKLEAEFRAQLNAHMKMLDASSQDARSSDTEAEKVKIMGK